MAADRTDARGQDMAAIERLYQQATQATLAGDMTALADLWTDDIVLIGPGQEAQNGADGSWKAAIGMANPSD